MSSVVIQGDTSGSVTLQAPSVAGSVTVTLPSTSGTMAVTAGSPSFTTITTTSDATINGQTIGKGGGSISTNTAHGASALAANSTGANQTAIGYQAGYSTNGGNGTYVGSQAGFTNATNASLTAIGFQAGYTLNQNTDVGASTFVGYQAGKLTTGTDNTFIGYAGIVNSSGNSNTGIGSGALKANTTASNNTAVGYQAGYSATTNGFNTFVGWKAGYSSTTAGNSVNCFIGEEAGYYVTSGTKNTIIGSYNGNQGGLDIRTASNYIVLSDGDGNPRGIFDGSGRFLLGGVSITNSAWQENFFNGGTYNGLILNDTSAASFTTYLGFSNNGTLIGSVSRVGATSAVAYNTTSDHRLKSNVADAFPVLEKLMNVKVRQYDWTEGDLHQDYGFVAQELEPVLSGIVTKGKTDDDMWQLDYSRLTPHLLKAIQELKADLDATKAELAAMKGTA